jgi:hypothetical protein
MTAISPRLMKFTAVGLLVFAVWAACMITLKIASARLALYGEIRKLSNVYDELWQRRVDLGSLEGNLSRLMASNVARQSALVADSERAALARLQQIVRRGVEEAGGQLLALTETVAPRAATSSVATQVRLRIAESSLPRLIAGWEDGETLLRLHELSVTSRARPAQPSSEVELSAIVRAHWVPQKGSVQ